MQIYFLHTNYRNFYRRAAILTKWFYFAFKWIMESIIIRLGRKVLLGQIEVFI